MLSNDDVKFVKLDLRLFSEHVCRSVSVYPPAEMKKSSGCFHKVRCEASFQFNNEQTFLPQQ